MERKETATHTIPHSAATADGRRVEVIEKADEFRVWEPFAQAWSDWSPGARSFHWGSIELSLLEDGNWETTQGPPQRLTRQG